MVQVTNSDTDVEVNSKKYLGKIEDFEVCGKIYYNHYFIFSFSIVEEGAKFNFELECYYSENTKTTVVRSYPGDEKLSPTIAAKELLTGDTLQLPDKTVVLDKVEADFSRSSNIEERKKDFR